VLIRERAVSRVRDDWVQRPSDGALAREVLFLFRVRAETGPKVVPDLYFKRYAEHVRAYDSVRDGSVVSEIVRGE